MKQLLAIGLVAAGLALTLVPAYAQSAAPPHDTFYDVGEINKASIPPTSSAAAGGSADLSRME